MLLSFFKIMRKSRILPVIILLILFVSCDDIIENNISEDTITIISPTNGEVINGNTVQFLWNSLSGANDYTLQLYKDNFLVLDSIVEFPPFEYVLNTGEYQWRIKGSNDAYETDFTFPETFEVTTSQDLSNQTIVLSSPTDNLFTNNTSIIFTWDNLENATSYTFELLQITPSGSVTIFLQENITSNSLSLDNNTIIEDAQYLWRVKGVNETSETNFSERTFYIDTVVPPTPSLLTPQFDEIFNTGEPIDFLWDFGNDPGVVDSQIISFYDIATDKNFVNIVENGNSTVTNITLNFNNTGIYYWRVKGEDQAGNIGSYNLNGKFNIQ